MKTEIPTAKELIKLEVEKEGDADWKIIKENFYLQSFIENLMIEFAKLRCEAALKAASEKAYHRNENNCIIKTKENKQSILTAYPLDLIK